MKISLLSEIIKSIASLHQSLHQALLHLCNEQQQWFEAIMQEQVKNQQMLQMQVKSTTPAAALLIKMSSMDDPKLSRRGYLQILTGDCINIFSVSNA